MLGTLTGLFSGVLFGVGLVVSGMTQASKVVAFLDFAGDWDPSLAFVMAGAIAVYSSLSLVIRRRLTPLHAAAFSLPSRRDLDVPLVLGAVVFGVGWGLSGWCPAPSIVAAGTGERTALVFLLAMLIGMRAHRWVHARGVATSNVDVARVDSES